MGYQTVHQIAQRLNETTRLFHRYNKMQSDMFLDEQSRINAHASAEACRSEIQMLTLELSFRMEQEAGNL